MSIPRGIKQHGLVLSQPELRGGNSEVKGTFPYKVGVVKALYILVSLCNWNKDNFLKNIEDGDFTPFADSEYTTQMTPTPSHIK